MTSTVYVSYTNKCWKAHTDETEIGFFILRSAAINAAVEHVKSFPKGHYTAIKVQDRLGHSYTYWDFQLDSFPPYKKPYGSF